MTLPLLARAAELLAAATKAPWHAAESGCEGSDVHVCANPNPTGGRCWDMKDANCPELNDLFRDRMSHANAALIVFAVNNLDAFVKCVAALVAVVECEEAGEPVFYDDDCRDQIAWVNAGIKVKDEAVAAVRELRARQA